MQMELDDMIEQFMKDEDVETPDNIGRIYVMMIFWKPKFKLVNSFGLLSAMTVNIRSGRIRSDNKDYMKKLVKNGEDLKVVGIVQPSEDANGALHSTPGI